MLDRVGGIIFPTTPLLVLEDTRRGIIHLMTASKTHDRQRNEPSRDGQQRQPLSPLTLGMQGLKDLLSELAVDALHPSDVLHGGGIQGLEAAKFS